MRQHRLAGVVSAGVVTSVLLAASIVPAGARAAQATPAYRGLANGVTLDLKLTDQQVTLGLAQATVDALPQGTGRGVALVLPTEAQVDNSASVQGTADDEESSSSCGDLEVTIPPDADEGGVVLDLETQCTSAHAKTASGVPSAGASSDGLHLTLDDASALSELPLDQAIGPVFDALAPLFEQLEENGIDAESLLSDVLEAITEGNPLIDVTLGVTDSSVETTADAVTAVSTSEGGVIDLLTQPAGLGPVARVTLSSSESTATANRVTGEETAAGTPAPVRIELAPNIVAALNPTPPGGAPGPPGAPGVPGLPPLLPGLPQGIHGRSTPTQIPPVIELPGGQSFCLPENLLCIDAAATTVSDTADGGKRATTNGVGIRLLATDQFMGGLSLTLSGATAEALSAASGGGGAAPGTPEGPKAPLARTGGETGLAVPIVLMASAGGGLLLARRVRRRDR